MPEPNPNPTEAPDDLAYWFPRLLEAGVPVPRTEIVRADCDLSPVLDGVTPIGWDDFLVRLRAAADQIGYPVFLRTGHGAGKHQWRETCYVPDPGVLTRHVVNLVEWSHLVDLFGLPTGTWAVREFLELDASFTAFAGMPVAREFRCFLRGGQAEPLCVHPYWPPESIERPSRPDWRPIIDRRNALDPHAEAAVLRLVGQVAPHFDGDWSMDVARHLDGRWFVTDMATARRSFHWPACPRAAEVTRA